MDAYQSLDVSPTATDEEIKRAYRRAQRKYHPDVGGTEQDSIRVNDAYNRIKDANKRALYDGEGRPQYDPAEGQHTAHRVPSATASTAPPRPRPGTPPPRQGRSQGRQAGFGTSAGSPWTPFDEFLGESDRRAEWSGTAPG